MLKPTHTKPHHHVYYLCEQTIIRHLRVEAVLPHLIEKKVIPEADRSVYAGKPQNGIKYLIGYLRNQSFETFLDFVEAILLAQGYDPSKAQSVTVVDSIVRAMREYDTRNGTSWTEDVLEIQEKYVRTITEEEEEYISETSGVQTPVLERATSGVDTAHKLCMPKLDYVEEPHLHCFLSEGGTCDHFEKYGFSAIVPPLAVPEGEEIKMKFGLCSYGPFSINERYLLASDFAVIVADGVFSKPVTVLMDHCLILPSYTKCSEVVTLKADHRKVTKDGLYTFDRFINPDIDPEYPKVIISAKEFCIICSVLDGDRFTSTSSSASGPIIEGNSSDAFSFERSYSAGSPALMRVSSTSSDNGDMEVSESPFPISNRKRKSETLNEEDLPKGSSVPSGRPRARAKAKSKRANMKRAHQGARPAKRKCTIAYAALLLQPKNWTIRFDDLYQFMIFICPDCPVAHEKCMQQARAKFDLEVEPNSIPIVLCKNAAKIKMSISETSSGWKVGPDKTPTVSSSEFGFGFMSAKDLSKKLQQNTCPPRIVFTAEHDNGANRRLNCKVKLEGVTTETGIEEDEGEEVFFAISASINKRELVHQERMDFGSHPGGYYPPHPPHLAVDYPPPNQQMQVGNAPAPGYPSQNQQMQLYDTSPGNPHQFAHPAAAPNQQNAPMGSGFQYNAPMGPGHPHQSALDYAQQMQYGAPPMGYQSAPVPPGPHYGHPSAPGPNHNVSMTKASSLEGVPPINSPGWNLPEDLQRHQHSQEYSDSPPPPEEGYVPLSISQSSTSPTQRSGIHRDSNIIASFGSLQLDGSGNSVPDRTRTGSYGATDHSQGSCVNNYVSINVQNVIMSADAKESGSLSQYVFELSYFDKRLNPKEKERKFEDPEIYSKVIPNMRNWKNTARRGFKLTGPQISQLEYGRVPGDFLECACQAYAEWKKGCIEPCTVWEMVKILHKSGEYDAIAAFLELDKERKN